MELIRDNWTKNDYDDFVEELRSYADEKYRCFHSSLIPDNDKDFFIGVRMPVMRKLGKEISKGNGRNFVQRIDSWAVCDGFCANLKETKKYKSEFFPHVCEYTKSDNPWIIRAGLVLMLDYYLEDEYIDTVLECCDNAKNPHYYVSMARAWLVATALAKCREQTMRYIKSNSLDNATFNKMIRKCVESFRIDDETKKYLKTLKRY